MATVNEVLSLFLDPELIKKIRGDYSYASDFETPSTQKTWITIYFFLAVACLSLAPLLAIVMQNATKHLELAFIFNGAAIAFAGVGIFACIQGIRAFYKKKVLDGLRAQYPSKP